MQFITDCISFFCSSQNLFILLLRFANETINNLNKNTMTKNMTNKVANNYESPICEIVEINNEGVLCASLEQFDEDDSDFVW